VLPPCATELILGGRSARLTPISSFDILPRLKAWDSYSARKAALNHLPSRFGGFLLLAISSIAHFTGATGVSRPENVDRADQVGVFLETTRDAGEAFLCLAVLC
jgi:hypothetical protein